MTWKRAGDLLADAVAAEPNRLANLDSMLAAVGAGARLYLRPAGIVGGSLAAEMLAADGALPLAGGPLAFATCAVIGHDDSGVRGVTVTAADLVTWCDGSGHAAAGLGRLLGHIIAPRLWRPGELWGAPRLMAIVNVTPNSFSDDGEALDPAAAIARARQFAEQGADIVDIGGESTRPGAAHVGLETELARVEPVLRGLQVAAPDIAVSIDTRHSPVMRVALDRGAVILNDVTALTGDADSLATASASAAKVVLMHKQGEPATMNRAPRYDHVALDVFDYLAGRIAACLAAGIGRERLIVDPGFGFGKRSRENLALLDWLGLYHALGCPIMVGLSRKGLLETHEQLAPRQRLPISLAATMHALHQGVQLLRVHDVPETRLVIDLWRRLNG